MRLTNVSLTHFRNLACASLEIPSSGIVLVGANGQGKTNLLEAIHCLAVFRSFRGTRPADAIAFGAEHFLLEGTVEREEGNTRRVRVAADRRGRKIAVDGHEVGRASDALGNLISVFFAPEDLSLVTGPPADRRRYMDGILAQTSVRYRRALAASERALRQRNEVLRSRAGAFDAMLEAWDDALVREGVSVVTARAALVRRAAEPFAAAAAEIAGDGGREEHGLEYRPSVPVDVGEAEDEATVEAAWREALVLARDVDRRRGWTTVGPHRDDVLVLHRGRDAARYGSQGEQRTAAIALRLLEAGVLEADTGHRPVLLLDDVLSELDPERADRLLRRLGDRHQRFVTSPRSLPWLGDGLARWTIDGGRIEPAAELAEIA